MRKKIKKWGNGAGIFLSKETLELYHLKIGDVVDLEMCRINEKTKKKKTKKKKETTVDDLLKRLPA